MSKTTTDNVSNINATAEQPQAAQQAQAAQPQGGQNQPSQASVPATATRMAKLSKGTVGSDRAGNVDINADIPADQVLLTDAKGRQIYIPVSDVTSVWNKGWFRGVAMGAAAVIGGVATHFGMGYLAKKSDSSTAAMM